MGDHRRDEVLAAQLDVAEKIRGGKVEAAGAVAAGTLVPSVVPVLAIASAASATVARPGAGDAPVIRLGVRVGSRWVWCGVLAVAMIACGSPPPQPQGPTATPAPTTTPAPLPHRIGDDPVTGEQLAQLAAELAGYRTWDVCALLDTAAAERVFGAGELDPDVAECRFSSDAWSARLWAGSPFDRADRDPTAAITVADRTLYRVRTADEDECKVRLPVSDRFAVELHVRAGAAASPDASPCAVAERYATEVAGRWDLPPDDGGARPLPLADRDPCAPADELTRRFAPGAAGVHLREMPSPSFCAVVLGEQAVTMSFSVDPFGEVAPGPERTLVEVGGRTAVQRTGDALYPCRIGVRWNAPPDPTLGATVQVNSSADCGAGRAAAEIVIEALG
ncbi:hypothetical protein [Pseudonocardia sp. MH-G8]|uniref:hypothetical protein n=1 Tax=Pseudonocardia sp. MH-G8 TaxID=1854588 RepID=UPI000BA130B6|nr:hypothetical protein [Pseudonocardia sp. MH-G8]OZM81802.1 hypothetical protein CFP66_12715 [Pseudonocardia sp. MH-G8]